MSSSKNVVGGAVRRFRDIQALSQTELAARCQRLGWDISRDTIAKIEGGARWVGDFELMPLSKALKVSIQELFPSNR